MMMNYSQLLFFFIFILSFFLIIPITTTTNDGMCPIEHKWIGHPISLFETLNDQTVKCQQCYHHCVLEESHRGICGNIHNYHGKLYDIVYGKPCSVAVDPVEKKPLYHFFPGSFLYSIGTVGCNMRCDFCQNWQISQNTRGKKNQNLDDVRKNLLSKYVDGSLSPKMIIDESLKLGCSGIAYTYNEPSIWMDYVYDIAKLANENGLKNILVSNGYQSIESIKYILPYLDGINVDLKSFSSEFYTKLTGARLKTVKRNIKIFYEMGVWIEVTTLVIPDENDSDEELRQIAKFIYNIDPNIVWHLSAYYDAGFRMKNKGRTPFRTILKGYHIGKKVGLKNIYLGNVQSEKHSTTFCPVCGIEVVKRGYWGRGGNIVGLNKTGHCSKCGHKIKGYWNENAKNIYDKEKKVLIPEYLYRVDKIIDKTDDIKIVYGTQTGVSEKFAYDLQKESEKYIDQKVKVYDLEEYDESNLENERLLIIITSTMFYGRIPRNGETFYNYLMNNNLNLSKLHYQIFGIGSTGTKPEHLITYQITAREIDDRLKILGARKIMNEVFEADKKNKFEKNLKIFIKKFWNYFSKWKPSFLEVENDEL